jgi:hypothetical protein
MVGLRCLSSGGPFAPLFLVLGLTAILGRAVRAPVSFVASHRVHILIMGLHAGLWASGRGGGGSESGARGRRLGQESRACT